MNVSFSLQARLSLVSVLRETRGAPEDDNRLLARDLIVKLRVDPEEAEVFETQLGNGQVMLDMRKVKAFPPKDADITDAEARKLNNVIKNGKWSPEDDDWFEPLLKDLKEVMDAARASKLSSVVA